MNLPQSSSLDDLLAALDTDARGLHLDAMPEAGCSVAVERLAVSASLEQGGENWIKHEVRGGSGSWAHQLQHAA